MDHVLVIAEASNNRTFLMRGAAAAFIDFEQCVNCLLQACLLYKSQCTIHKKDVWKQLYYVVNFLAWHTYRQLNRVKNTMATSVISE